MHKTVFVMLLSALILSSCGEKSEVEPAVVNASQHADESDRTIEVEQPMQAPVAGMEAKTAVKPSAPAIIEKQAVKEVPDVIKKTVPVKSGSLSREDGLALAGKSGCLICHMIETKLIGPAWGDVSKRYKGDADAKTKLMASVKSGSNGKWTEVTGGMRMPANSPRVSDENIGKLVGFILSL